LLTTNEFNFNEIKTAFQSKAEPQVGHTDMLFCSRNFDLDPIIIIYDPDVGILKIYLQSQNEVSGSMLSKVRA